MWVPVEVSEDTARVFQAREVYEGQKEKLRKRNPSWYGLQSTAKETRKLQSVFTARTDNPSIPYYSRDFFHWNGSEIALQETKKKQL